MNRIAQIAQLPEFGTTIIASDNLLSVRTGAARLGRELGRKFVCRRHPQGVAVWRLQ